jgi:peptidoglycan/LPS O-acetylase OafA/YrhL
MNWLFMSILSNINSINRQLNNFDFLRLSAAIFVIITHSFSLLNLDQAEPLTKISGGLNFGTVGIDIFFVISGYLVLSSWDRNPKLKIFFKNRILRIFPALTIVICVTALFLGPLVTTLNFKDYFSNINTWLYLQNITIYFQQYYLPGVFENNLFKFAVNGSLWTLPIEFSLYILLFILGVIGIYRKRLIIIILFTTLFLFYSYQSISTGISTGITIPLQYGMMKVCLLSIFFFAGMICYLYRDKIIFDWKVLIILFVIWIASFHSVYLMATSFICIPYFVVYFAFISNKRLNSFGKYGDFSYGTYIIAWPVQQTIIYVFYNNIHPLVLIIFTLIVTLPLAVISWYLIEQPALKLKNRDIFAFEEKIS